MIGTRRLIAQDADQLACVLRPSLPPTWNELVVRRLRVGETRLDLRVVRERESGLTRWRLDAEQEGPELHLVFEPLLPPLSTVEEELLHEWRVVEGPSVQLPAPPPVIAGRSRHPRLVAEGVEDGVVQWTFAGRAGSEVRLPTRSDRALEVEGGVLAEGLLGLAFPGAAGEGWTEVRVTLRPR